MKEPPNRIWRCKLFDWRCSCIASRVRPVNSRQLPHRQRGARALRTIAGIHSSGTDLNFSGLDTRPEVTHSVQNHWLSLSKCMPVQMPRICPHVRQRCCSSRQSTVPLSRPSLKSINNARSCCCCCCSISVVVIGCRCCDRSRFYIYTARRTKNKKNGLTANG